MISRMKNRLKPLHLCKLRTLQNQNLKALLTTPTCNYNTGFERVQQIFKEFDTTKFIHKSECNQYEFMDIQYLQEVIGSV